MMKSKNRYCIMVMDATGHNNAVFLVVQCILGYLVRRVFGSPKSSDSYIIIRYIPLSTGVLLGKMQVQVLLVIQYYNTITLEIMMSSVPNKLPHFLTYKKNTMHQWEMAIAHACACAHIHAL